jgi:hypothetical protein
MIQNRAPDTLREIPHTSTLRPPPLPESERTIVGTDAEIIYDNLTTPVIARGSARATLAGAALDVLHALTVFDGVARAIIRGSGAGDDVELPVDGSLISAKQFLEDAHALLRGPARELDAPVLVTP